MWTIENQPGDFPLLFVLDGLLSSHVQLISLCNPGVQSKFYKPYNWIPALYRISLGVLKTN